ncbi:hypothetical protein OFY17_05000 [Marinomonas sp. C2222]|uniref:Nucleoside transporter/FeoB GTPase Gate domain-containing protein n=1 Tax=Marinomonas sargassi TaxID=2984494 RepID=A0ABT2YQT6_9GAMM|nr:nucleoside recognition domain-containing protein [Marinomonas sargassi]MCV2402242.1 hypothetical protein [Marinomonas sargassi]
MDKTSNNTLSSSFTNLTRALQANIIGRWFLEVVYIFWGLIKIMVPVLIIVRVIELLGWVTVLGKAISPLMIWFGLPGDMGLVWMTAMTSNLYSAMAVFYQLGGAEQLTVAQVSVLSTMMLIAHGLPVEGSIAAATGTKLWFALCFRIGGAMLMGVILHHTYTALNLLQTPVTITWQPEVQGNSWSEWFILQAQTLVIAFVIISVLTLVIRLLRFLGVEKLIHALLSPLLRLIGVGPKATNIIIIGVMLGLSYGGSLLIKESKSGNIEKKDIFLTMAFLALAHSLIEDTLLILLLGPDLFTILWARLAFAFVIVALLSQALKRLSAKRYAWLYKPS